MDGMREQARNFGADIRTGVATAANLGEKPFRITVDGAHEIEAYTLIIATGAAAKYLGLESPRQLLISLRFGMAEQKWVKLLAMITGVNTPSIWPASSMNHWVSSLRRHAWKRSFELSSEPL